ncbi:MAG TPA: ATPase domain-containing protein, partial [Blastocatellia bacterium]|nr:ATPase domain-containing protein [Blastocatellia bacterium]
ILTLYLQPRGRYCIRQIEITKSRGQDFISGKHTLRIEGGKGVRVYQRAEARPLLITDQPTSTRRTSLGVPAVDEMIGSGIFDGSVTLVVGVTGTGKTVLGTEFLVEGARQGKKGLLVTLDEHPAQIIRNADGLGLDLKKYIDEGMLLVYFDSPQELEPDVHFHQVMRLVEENDIQRVVIDSLTAYRINHATQRDFHDFIYALTTHFKDRLVTAFLNYESPEMLGLSQISEDLRASTIVDNIILLNYVEISNRLRRAITVPKARGSAPTRQTYEYTIQQGGITLLPTGTEPESQTEVVPQLPFASYYGVLARSPARVSPIIEESIVTGKELPEVEIPFEEELADKKTNGAKKTKSTPRKK